MVKFLKFFSFIGLIFLADGIALGHHGAASGNGTVGGGINTANAYTLDKNQWLIDGTVLGLPFNSFSDSRLQSFPETKDHIHSLDSIVTPSIGISYGLTNRLMIGISLPYIHENKIREKGHEHGSERHSDHHLLPVKNLGNSEGFGDLYLNGQWQFLNVTNVFAAAALFGLYMPTGGTLNYDNEGDLFDAEHQPGKGAWCPTGGLAASLLFNEHTEFDTNFLYIANTQGTQRTSLGDVFNYNFSLSYNFLPANTSQEAADKLLGIIELNGIHEEKVHKPTRFDNNTGGDIVYLSPGIKYIGKHFTPYFSFGEPIYQQVNGFHPKINYRIVTGFYLLIT